MSARLLLLITLQAAALAAGLRAEAAAQPPLPRAPQENRDPTFASRVVRMIVPFPPGAATDTVARIVEEPIEARLGARVATENRAGAAGNIAADVVLRAAPDGHTWLVGTPGLMTINALLYPTMKYDPALAFAPVTLLAQVPYVLVINPYLPPRTLEAFIEFASRRPWILNFGSAGSGSTLHLAAELFKSVTQTRIVHVAYRGGAPAITELVGGHIQMMFGSVPLVGPYVEAGRLRALGVTGTARSAHMPAVPTLGESGLAEFEFTGWFGLFVPVQTPRRTVAWLNEQIVAALAAREVRARLFAIGAEPMTSTPTQLHELIRRDALRWERVVRSNNIKPDWEDMPQ